MAELVNASELGRRLGVSEGAIRKHRRRGLYKPNKDGLYDVEQCKAAWEAGRDPDAVLRGVAGGEAVSTRPAGGPLAETSLSRARAANAVMQMRRHKLALDKATGALLSKADAVSAVISVVTVVNERLDGVAARIAPRVAGMQNVAEIERIVRDEIRSARQEIARLADAIEVVGNENAA